MGACAFNHIWIPHYPHIVEPLYGLLKKGRKFKWDVEHVEAVKSLKEMVTAALAHRKVIYKLDTPVHITVDTRLTEIG